MVTTRTGGWVSACFLLDVWLLWLWYLYDGRLTRSLAKKRYYFAACHSYLSGLRNVLFIYLVMSTRSSGNEYYFINYLVMSTRSSLFTW